MTTPYRLTLFAILVAGAPLMALAQGLQWGRAHIAENYYTVEMGAGILASVDMMVPQARRETRTGGGGWSVADTFDYGANDFNSTVAGPIFSLRGEQRWDLVTFALDLSLLMPSSDAVAGRNYFIGVGDVSYYGTSADGMAIPSGTPFTYSFTGIRAEALWSFTPVGLVIDNYVRITPSLDAGIYSLIGFSSLDAGEATGMTFYQNPPQNYVIGGNASWLTGTIIPEIGPGLELRLGEPGCLNYALRMQYLFFIYSGGSYPFAWVDNRDDAIDLTYSSIRVKNTLEFAPFSGGSVLSLGLGLDITDVNGTSETGAYPQPGNPGVEQRVTKDYDFGCIAVTASMGLTF